MVRISLKLDKKYRALNLISGLCSTLFLFLRERKKKWIKSVQSKSNSANRIRQNRKYEVFKSRDYSTEVYDIFIKLQIYRLTASTACEEKDSYFKGVKSGTPLHASVTLKVGIIFRRRKNL
jgi:hypothetical protein